MADQVTRGIFDGLVRRAGGVEAVAAVLEARYGVGCKGTVCVRALNDSRYVARHQRRIEALNRDAAKIRKYMADNPAPGQAEQVAAE